MTRLIPFLTVIALALGALAGPAAAQQGGPFAPRLIVNDRAITNYELAQRRRFVQVLNTPGDLDEVALNGLIEDRLRMAEAAAMGIRPGPEEIEAGMAEFASRANLSTEEFLAGLASEGIAPETFRDFVEAGIAWREVIRARFGPRAQVTEAEIDRALALSSQRGGARVLLSEIILPADTPERQAQSQTLANRLSQISTPGAFAAAARDYSVAPTRGRGGRLDWLPLANLPPQIAAQVLVLGPGEVTDPIPVPNAIALFQLRAIEETGLPEPETVSVEYARLLLPGDDGRQAARVRAQLDTCDDLYGVAKGQPEELLTREVKPVSEVPQDVALELAKLDEGEVSTALTQGGARVLLMLCGRTPAIEEAPDRAEVRRRLVNQRLGSYSESYLAQIRADAIIREP
ncbi:peptidyl-prolyl cis-trans isomerase SurA [Rhodovulum iodosum]|uniref:Parvulin-like PPIase n=1 Tax=Rhodovulum iodosum TaxID=68291 RepID=A0ABV3XVV4_9RHOB|nr:peptidylprolyl isomerase [Rhodovulum robiginosum]RSK33630.1 peptidylprolyl isomerase [Rhodovulum robiginosum]